MNSCKGKVIQWKVYKHNSTKFKHKSKISWCGFDFAKSEARLEKTKKATEAPNLWDNPTEAKSTMRSLARLQRDIDGWHALQQRTIDAIELASLEDDEI